MKIIVPDFVLPVLAARACSLLESCDLVVVGDHGTLQGDPSGAEVVMLPWALPVEVTARLVQLPTVRWIHTVTAGVDHVVAALPGTANVQITNASGVFDVPIAETVLAYILAVAKRIPEFLAQQRAHNWHLLRLRELRDLTVGIIGLGNIGVAVADRCKAVGMRVLAVRRDPQRKVPGVDHIYAPDSLPDLLGASDFVVVAVPLTPETRGLVGRAELRRMRADAWLINIARGAIVDEAALVDALREGWIGGAALDVFEEEPLPATSPLWDLPHVILTPHNSWSTPHLRQREAELFLDNLERYLRGEPLRNVVDPSRGY